MSHSKPFPGSREIPPAYPSLPVQPLIPGQPEIPEQLRNLIHTAVAAINANLQTADLPPSPEKVSPDKRLFCVEESFYSRRTPATKHTPAILVKGMVYHDGKVLRTMDSGAKNHAQHQVDHSLRIKKRIKDEIVHTRTHILQGVQTLVMAEWCLFQTDEADPREYGEILPPRPSRGSPDATLPLRYHNSMLYTIHSTRHAQLDRYISAIQNQQIYLR